MFAPVSYDNALVLLLLESKKAMQWWITAKSILLKTGINKSLYWWIDSIEDCC